MAGELDRHLRASADRAGLSREERIELAEMMLKRDIVSWSSLTRDEQRRMLDACEGWRYISALHLLRSPLPAEPGVVKLQEGSGGEQFD